MVRDLSRLARGLFEFQRIDQLDRGEEPNAPLMVLDALYQREER